MGKLMNPWPKSLSTKSCYTHSNTVICLFSLLSLFMLACQEDSEKPEESSLPNLDTYLERFEEEARLRGYDFDLSGIETAYMDELKAGGQTYCGFGYSNYRGTGIRRIEISTSASCNWDRRNEAGKESLFFHEIGHAFFNRTHDESRLCDGSPLSLMNSTIFGASYKETEDEKRTYYIDELIDRMAALDQCIDYERDWVNDSVFYQYTAADTSWVFDAQDGNYIGTSSATDNLEGEAITLELSPGSTTDESGRWFRRIDNPNIPECTDVTLSVKMNSEQLSGTGAAISIRAFHAPAGRNGAQSEEYLYLTTTDAPVAGQLNDYVEELTIPCYSRKTTFIVLFLRLMAGTEGKVNFEDIQLTVK